eukprot:TRINITY_DN827_c0_g3_i2.p1 TRINITY_DN827_c0_g3~~TRINITY_DN827_c0_g3_i2.p1  ORF type:complete len:1483 (-),score=306.29 TRINITY_DN827_c0_g3_i2:234-4682(-)
MSGDVVTSGFDVLGHRTRRDYNESSSDDDESFFYDDGKDYNLKGDGEDGYERFEDDVELRSSFHQQSSTDPRRRYSNRVNPGDSKHANAKRLTQQYFKLDDGEPLLNVVAQNLENWKTGRPPCTVIVNNVTYSVEVSRRWNDMSARDASKWRDEMRQRKASVNKLVLDSVSFHVKPGTMTVVLGAPGCGKTTMIRLLANLVRNGDISGDITFNGVTPNPRDYHRKVAYVRQDDIHQPQLTVRETLFFAAQCQMPETSTVKEVELRVLNVMELLGISHRADTLVGDALLRGVSGGEKRRVSIGIELCKAANLLLLDEPTTGLDATTALDVFKSLRVVADHVAPVVSSLQQPGRELFELFDNVVLMSHGKVVYFGPVSRVLPYFENMGYVCPTRRNPSDFLQDIIDKPHVISEPSSGYSSSSESSADMESGLSVGNSSDSDRLIGATDVDEDDNNYVDVAAAKAHASHLREVYEQSDIKEEMWRHDNVNPNDGGLSTEPYVDQLRYATSRVKQFRLCLWRTFRILMNVPATFITRVVRAIIVSLIVGSAFFQLGDTQDELYARLGLGFYVVSYAGLGAISNIGPTFNGRDVYYYQRESKYYSSLPLFFATTVMDIPLLLLENLVFGVIVYFMAGLRLNVVAFLYFIMLVTTFSFAMNSFCKGLAYASRDIMTAIAIAPVFVASIALFSGFPLKKSLVPTWLVWLYWSSPFMYANQGYAINELLGEDFTCESEDEYPDKSDKSLHRSFPKGYNGVRVCPVTEGETALEGVDFYTESYAKWLFLLGVLGWVVIFSVMCWLAMRFIKFAPKTRRNKDFDTLATEDLFNLDVVNKELSVRAKEEQVRLDFKDVRYSVTVESGMLCRKTSKEVKLLNGVSGYVKPGMLIALMGPSGAGKTTLLDVLANRKTGGKITGDILFNNCADKTFMHRFTGYVEQQNLHILNATVFEAVLFSANTRLSSSMTPTEKKDIARWAMAEMGLLAMKSVLLAKCSFEELKRLTVAVEMAAYPPLLFLDEPTSGLDSIAAAQVMRAVKRYASMGKSVVCTIHQPSEQIFGLFTHMLLMARKGGRTIYFGELGANYQTVLNYFKQKLGQSCEETRNPADFVLDMSSLNTTPPPEDVWDNSKEKKQVDSTIDKFTTGDAVPVPETYASRNAVGLPAQLRHLMARTFRGLWRRPDQIWFNIFRQLWGGAMMGLFYCRIGDDQAAVARITSACYFAVLYVGLSAFSFIPPMFADRAAVYRERAAGTYRTTAYATTAVLSGIPHQLGCIVLFLIPFYFISGLRTDDGGAWFWYFGLVYTAVSLLAMAMAQTFAAISPTIEAASGLNGMVTSCSTLFAGFLLRKAVVPSYWIWLYWSSYFHYALEALVVGMTRGLQFECDDEEQFPIVVSPYTCFKGVSKKSCNALSLYDSNKILFATVPPMCDDILYGVCDVKTYCKYTDGSDVQDDYYMNASWMWADVAILYGMYGLYVLLLAVALRYCNHIKR